MERHPGKCEYAMTFRGLLAFSDPAKDGVAKAIARLTGPGISVRLVTGDHHAARRIATDVGIGGALLTGEQIDRLDDRELARAVPVTTVFAEIDPTHKQRLVAAFRAAGETGGFLGDGINDASSAFDLATFVVLRAWFGVGAHVFRSSWFVASTATELAVLLVLRTSRPFWRSRPASALPDAAVAGSLPFSSPRSRRRWAARFFGWRHFHPRRGGPQSSPPARPSPASTP